ncbi:MAG: O-antigen ligase family protein [Limnothrix sp.]
MEQVATRSVQWERWLGWAGLALLIVFMFLPNNYYLMVAFPWVMMWQLGFLLLGLSLLISLRRFDQPFRPLGYGLDWAAGAVAIACVLSAIMAPFKGVAFWNLATISGYGVALYTLRNWLGEKPWTWQYLWRGLVILGFAITTCSLGQWYLIDGGFDRTRLPLGHHNFVAAYLCLALPLVFSFALTQTGKTRILLILLAGLFPYNIYVSSSRGVFLGFFVGAIATIAFVIWRTKGRKRIIFAAIALAVMTAMTIVSLQHPRVQRVIQVDTSQGIVPTVELRIDGESEDRLFMWRAGFNILKDRPLTGVGLGNMSRMYNLYRPINAGSGAAHIQQLHGTPAQLLGELGLIGGAAIAFLLVQLIRLGWRVHTHADQFVLKRLLYGLGGSWFAYGVATLTDYQLENITISLTLIGTIVLLIAAADATLPAAIPGTLPESGRRSLSLMTLTSIFAALMAGLPFTIGTGLFAQGEKAWRQGNSEKAFDDIALGRAINPWNPVYSLRLAQWLLETREYQQDEPQRYQKTTELIAEYFQEAWTMAPNDFYFNTNLAVVLAELDPAAGQLYLERAVQLLPRESRFAYLLLGYAYLGQNRPEEAIAALALEGLIDPSVMALSNWDQEPLATVRIPAVQKSLELYERLLEAVAPDAPERVMMQEQMAWISWWHGLPIPYLDQLEQFSPMVQALILGDRQPENALALIDAELQTEPESLRWKILKAWFDPTFDFELSIRNDKENTTQDLILKSSTSPDLTLQTWLKQLPLPTKNITGRLASRLVYRVEDFEAVDFILLPRSQYSEPYQLFSALGINAAYPRTFPPLDQFIQQILIEDLELSHPPKHHTEFAK